MAANIADNRHSCHAPMLLQHWRMRRFSILRSERHPSVDQR